MEKKKEKWFRVFDKTDMMECTVKAKTPKEATEKAVEDGIWVDIFSKNKRFAVCVCPNVTTFWNVEKTHRGLMRANNK